MPSDSAAGGLLRPIIAALRIFTDPIFLRFYKMTLSLFLFQGSEVRALRTANMATVRAATETFFALCFMYADRRFSIELVFPRSKL
jgi:hypothetical protein